MSDPLGPLPEGVDADPEYEKKLVSPATIKVRMLSSGDQAIFYLLRWRPTSALRTHVHPAVRRMWSVHDLQTVYEYEARGDTACL